MDSVSNFVDLTHSAVTARDDRGSTAATGAQRRPAPQAGVAGGGALRDTTNTPQEAAERATISAGQNKKSEGRSKLAKPERDSGKGSSSSSSSTSSGGVGTKEGDANPKSKKRKTSTARAESVRGKLTQFYRGLHTYLPRQTIHSFHSTESTSCHGGSRNSSTC